METQSFTKKYFSTRELAELFGVKPGTPLHSLCMRGHYLGMKPVKLPNRLLGWPREIAEKVLNGGKIEEGSR